MKRIALLITVLASAASARATTIVLPTDSQLVSKSGAIVKGVVVRSEAVERDGAIWTESEIAVERILKGKVPASIVIRELGGVVGSRLSRVFGAPEYHAGERVLAFVTATPRGDYQTVDLFVGKFTEGRTMAGQRLWLRDAAPADVNVVDGNFHPVSTANVQRDGGAFESFIDAGIEARPPMTAYTIENPILDGALGDGGPLQVRPDFELISDAGTIFRWGGFDSNASAAWYSIGSQGGYNGGGLSELQSAMSSWTSYGSSKILYNYAGSRSGTGGGLNQTNGFHEVMFEDPRSEISGSWNPSTGGVVGQGGFIASGGSASWTAPFSADATHTAGPKTVWLITEGNLTIQDGVSPARGMASSRLAEIIAHEFGHTLGFGHSADQSALMYYSVTGLGPSLRSDDQVAARWLYPNGAVAPPPVTTAPAAPSALTASVNGTSVTLQWTDNSTNENGFRIFAASGSNGAFSAVGDTAAGQRSATLTGFAPGTYRIYVAAFNAAGLSAASNTTNLSISQQLSAAFSVSPGLSGVAGTTTFTFTDESTGSITSRVWNFGDGSASSVANPTHSFVSAGTYTVTLTVNGGGTQSQTSKQIVVTAPPAPLAANFNWSPASPTTSTDVAFTDLSTGGVTSWQWNFGDGSVSSQQNPVKRYATPGSFGITLTVFRNSESRVVSKSISVTNPLPATPLLTAAFDFAPASPSVGAQVAFADRTTGGATSWTWSFGDGSTSTQQNPSHAFAAAGTYTVTLVAANGGSSGSASRQVVVAEAPAFRALVSATAQTSGVGGSYWRTELTVFNAGISTAQVQLIFLPGAGGSSQTRSVTLVPRQSATYTNVLSELFGLSSAAGALSIVATGAAAPELRVSSRTFTEGATGTYGQDVPAVFASDLGGTLYLTGIDSTSSFRTNVGLVNARTEPAVAALTLLDADGSFLGSTNVTLPGNSFQQAALGAYFAALGASQRSGMTLRVGSGAPGSISAYASVVDNRTQDPVFVQGVSAPSATSITLPAVGRAPGANGTFWRSDVAIHNPRSEPLALTLRFIAAGSDGRNGTTRAVTVAAGRTTTIGDVLSLFDLTSASGAMEISWNGGAGPIVTSRTYTSAGSGGTFGQSIAPVNAYGPDRVVTGLRNNTGYRSNVGFVNGGTTTVGLSLLLVGSSGETIGTTFLEVPPKSQKQSALRDLFGTLPNGDFTLIASGGAGSSLFAYGSVIDNTSGDPVFYAGR